mmetsp:Transcript_64850/g.143193  ORF Transcript_64850/g.143193 Transcript_64850/m.143193 type:complete len:267 (-) Transcript_64850:71-871(-)
MCSHELCSHCSEFPLQLAQARPAGPEFPLALLQRCLQCRCARSVQAVLELRRSGLQCLPFGALLRQLLSQLGNLFGHCRRGAGPHHRCRHGGNLLLQGDHLVPEEVALLISLPQLPAKAIDLAVPLLLSMKGIPAAPWRARRRRWRATAALWVLRLRPGCVALRRGASTRSGTMVGSPGRPAKEAVGRRDPLRGHAAHVRTMATWLHRPRVLVVHVHIAHIGIAPDGGWIRRGAGPLHRRGQRLPQTANHRSGLGAGAGRGRRLLW